MWTIIKLLHKLRHNRHGLSNVIVVVLSLVILVIIASNVILWSFEMNQLDWEKMQESLAILNISTNKENPEYSPIGYHLEGSTSWLSGNISNLSSNDNVYMTFRSHTSNSSQPLYAHQETTAIGGSSYYLLKPTSADVAGITLFGDAGTLGRKLMGRFVYLLDGVSSIPASTWTIYYRASQGHVNVESHCDVDILVRRSNGTVRSTVATNVANSANLTGSISWATLSGTYAWSAYMVVNQTDYLEIDYYREVTKVKAGYLVNLRIDDNTLAVADQTRAANLYISSHFTSEVEFTGLSNPQSLYELVWSVDSSWTTDSVLVSIQVYDNTLGGYPTFGDGYCTYTSSSTADTDETKTQTITIDPMDFRNATGHWKLKVKGIKKTPTQFDFKADLIEIKTRSYEAVFTFRNGGSLTAHLVSLWIENSTHHQRFGINVYLNSGETWYYVSTTIYLPNGTYIAKVVSERGNIAVYSEG